MSETNKDALANISALFELDKARFRSLTIDVREARRRADDLLAKITVIKDAFVAAELQKEEEALAEKEPAPVVEEVKDVAPENKEPEAPEAAPVAEVVAEPAKEEKAEPAPEPAKPEAKQEAPVVEAKPAAPQKNPLRPDVPEPKKFKPIIYIPESERNGGSARGGRAPYGQRPFTPRDTFGGLSEKDKPMFVPPQPGKGGKGGKKQSYDKVQSAYEDKKGASKKSILRRELENGKEIDDSEIARRFKSKKYQKQAPVVTQTVIEKAVINVDPVPIKLLSEKIGKPIAEIMKMLLLEGVMKTINDSIEFSVAELIAANYGIELELKADKSAEEKLEELITEDSEEDNTEPRAPIVTIMGHVDHGKTSLLDYIRNSHVAEKEAGGITQHIGAYTIEKNGQMITFIDTPGHEAFTSMRARGAMVTDIAIIVVAADDGIMPQTIEAINHAKAAAVPIIVAINKIDKHGADIDRVKRELLNYDVVVGEYGGDVSACPVSAKTGQGVEDLLDTINLFVSEELKPKANSKKAARGTVIEAKIDKAGPVATILVQNGTLRVGDIMVAGSACGRVKSMLNDKGKLVKTAGPSMPVSVLGFDEAPSAGDKMIVLADEKLARKIAEERKIKVKVEEDNANKPNLEDIFAQINEGKLKELNLIVKADVQGSVEALVQEVLKLSNDEVKVKVIHKGVGAINESDVVLASTSKAIIIGFNVRPDANSKAEAAKLGVDVRNYRIIYDVLNDITLALKGMLAPKFKENVLGRAEVREIFKISGVGVIAGCKVVEGKLQRNADVRLLRDNVVITENKVSSLKRMKDDVKEVLTGFECGVGIENYNDIKVGDVIECFIVEEVQQ
ncbi:MAG: translation initiation factor IF-2 [Clostridia bacterium]|nr:translation initiation factor IF-2 [Clostridia bacterium]